MAKKQAGGPSIGLIITLIFFILATFITGTVAYFGYADQEQLKKDTETAKKDTKDWKAKYMQERARKAVLRIAMGINAPNPAQGEAGGESDRFNLVAQMNENRADIMDEYERILRVLADVLPRDGEPFKWQLMSKKGDDPKGEGTDADKDPATAPQKTIPAIIQVYKDERDKAVAALADAKKTANDAIEKKVAAEKQAADEKKTYTDAIAALTEKVKKFQDDQIAQYKALEDKHKGDAVAFDQKIKTQAKELEEKKEEANKKGDLNIELKARLQVAERAVKEGTAVGVDAVNLEERKGEIVRRESNGFVLVNIGSSKKLKPQITFLVVSANVSWPAMLEKEESLKKSSNRNDRLAFEDNPYVKAGIEIVEVTGPETSRAKVIFENEPIRNPIQPRDQIFNLAWDPNEQMRIAFAGIIDLDGDGLDNNEDFLRLLERQGVIVDEYLKLKPLGFVKRDNRGMSLRTKYLVIAPDPRLESLPLGTSEASPQRRQILATIEKMSDMKKRARDLGIQMIEAHKFLSLIGYKLPRSPLPPAYGAGIYIDPNAPPPMEGAEPKEGKDPKEMKAKE